MVVYGSDIFDFSWHSLFDFSGTDCSKLWQWKDCVLKFQATYMMMLARLLSGLAMQTDLWKSTPVKPIIKLQKIAGISRNAISQMRDLVWSIDSRRETIEDLLERMRELAEELLLPKDISF